MRIVLNDVTKEFAGRGSKQGKTVKAVDHFSAEIPDGVLVALLGPSGCGKSTTLNIICGLETPTSGTVFFDDTDVTHMPVENRGVGMVLQHYALYPMMTAQNNILFPLENLKGKNKLTKPEMLDRVQTVAKLVQIEDLLDRKPKELSGGQQQRVAIARALVKMPKVLLLDEPLSNLDARLRIDMRVELKRLHKDTGTTIVYVTHDQVEALTMSTKVALFKAGEIAQIATPLELYTNPIDLETADFVGSPRINLIDAKGVYDGNSLKITSPLGSFCFGKDSLKPTEEIPEGSEFDVVLGVRPEVVQVYAKKPADADVQEATVYASQPAGSETIVTLDMNGTQLLALQVDLKNYEMNQDVWIGMDPKRLNVFNKKTTRLIRFAEANIQEDAE
jgi:multiple sugar transport system ATP-binding protein